MIHGRFHPLDVFAASRLQVLPAPDIEVPRTEPARTAATAAHPTVRLSVLDRIEARIWARHDARLRAVGWEVALVGRWRRAYRHPRLVRAASAAAQNQYYAQLDAERRASVALAETEFGRTAGAGNRSAPRDGMQHGRTPYARAA